MWSIDLFGPMACKRFGQDGCQHNNNDTHSLSFSNQWHDDTAIHVQYIVNPDRSAESVVARYGLNLLAICSLSTIAWNCDYFPTLNRPLCTPLLRIQCSLANKWSELCRTASRKCVQSAVTGRLSIALMLKPQHPVLPTCEQMWRSLNYTVDLMT